MPTACSFILLHSKTFFKKIHSRGKHINTILPASFKHLFIAIFTIVLSRPMGSNERLIASDFSAQNPFRAEDFCSIIIETRVYRKHQKPTELPQISYSSPEISKSLFLYQRYTKGIQKAGAIKYASLFCQVFFTKLAYFLHISKKNRTFAPVNFEQQLFK